MNEYPGSNVAVRGRLASPVHISIPESDVDDPRQQRA